MGVARETGNQDSYQVRLRAAAPSVCWYLRIGCGAFAVMLVRIAIFGT